MKHLFGLFLFLSVSFCFGQNAKFYQRTYTGSLGGKYPILMWLQWENDKIVGSYSYKSVGEPLSLEGKKNGNVLNLTEKDMVGNTTGLFSLTLSGENLQGKWTNAEGNKSYDLTLNRIGKETVNMQKYHFEGKGESNQGEDALTCSFNIDVVELKAVNNPSFTADYSLEKLEQNEGGGGHTSQNWRAGTIVCGDVSSESELTITAIQVGDILSVEKSGWQNAGGAHGNSFNSFELINLKNGQKINQLAACFDADQMTELCLLLDQKLKEQMELTLEPICLTDETEGSGTVYQLLKSGRQGSQAKDWNGTFDIYPTGISFTYTFNTSYAAQVCSSVSFNLSFKELSPFISENSVFAPFK